ncbi:hypothetical protein NF672_13480 [Pseudomonas moraviensis]|uniref:hypothetical protein n=1 Tax=Pseudomonas moraviensis TaxID=321662 RepID=UPI002092B5BF|nr:hypothetical protein [Pseudomonas moraviensis]UST56476.1 hypothetical protein NF672_13480 [Pseudomonas moraviensis]
MRSEPSAVPNESHLREMLGHWKALGVQSFTMEEALQWCATQHPGIALERFRTILVGAVANRNSGKSSGYDLLWQLTKGRFVPYDPTVDPAPGSSEAVAWVVRIALEERPDVAPPEILDQYCVLLAKAIEHQSPSNKPSQKMADGLAGLVRAGKIEEFLSQVSELGAAEYFRATYPDGFENHVSNPESSNTGPDKNFDFSFETEGIRFNAEVKAFSKTLSANDHGGAKFFLPEPVKRQLYKSGVKMASTLAPNIGRFLQDANSQLLRRGDDINVVLLCCNDPDEYADVMESLFGRYGMIGSSRTAGNDTMLPDSVIPNLSLLINIDAVVVCMAGFLHSGIVNTLRLTRAYNENDLSLSSADHPWDFRYSFPCGFWLHRAPPDKERQIAFQKAFNSHLKLLLDYYNQHKKNWQAAVFSLINQKPS